MGDWLLLWSFSERRPCCCVCQQSGFKMIIELISRYRELQKRLIAHISEDDEKGIRELDREISRIVDRIQACEISSHTEAMHNLKFLLERMCDDLDNTPERIQLRQQILELFENMTKRRYG